MSVRSTYQITRQDAEQKLISEMMQKVARVHTMSDDELEDAIIEEYRNFSIIDSYDDAYEYSPTYR